MITAALDAAAVAERAFVLGYPLVLTHRTMAQATAVTQRDPASMRAPVNQLVQGRDTPDTLRISAWLDLAAEPLVLSRARHQRPLLRAVDAGRLQHRLRVGRRPHDRDGVARLRAARARTATPSGSGAG